MKRGQLFWGGALVLFGGLLLANEMGLRLPNGNSITSLFWPVLLIGFGVWVLIGVFVQRSVETEVTSIDLQNARTANLRIDHGAGEICLHSGAGVQELARGSFAGGLEHTSTLNGDTLNVRMHPANDFLTFPSFFSRSQLDWDVALNAATPIALDMNLGANKSEINLQDLTITDIRLKTGASDTVITLPSRGRLNLDCEIGAASLTVIVPEGVSIRAKGTIGAGDFHVDRTRFPNNESPDFATAENAVDIHVKGGAVSVKIK